MSPWYVDDVMKGVKMGIGRMKRRPSEERKEWKLLGLAHIDDLILRRESKKGLRVIIRSFTEVCKRRSLEVNANKSKVVISGEGGGIGT